MGATAAVALAAAGAVAGGASSYINSRTERENLKQQYKNEEYNAQMDKMEKEVDLARQDKVLQKQLAETMATQNNLFGESGLEGSAGNILQGTFLEGQNETRSLAAQAQHVQNRYITTSAIRRKNFNKNMKMNTYSTIFNTLSGALGGGASGYSAGNDMFGSGNSGGE